MFIIQCNKLREEDKHMYFTNDKHKINYETLMDIYKLKKGENVQYESTIYVAAIPEIFNCFDIKTLDTWSSPLFSLMRWDDKQEKFIIASPALTGSTSRLVEFALSCYNGHSIDLNDILSSVVNDTLFQVLVETMKIRKGILTT